VFARRAAERIRRPREAVDEKPTEELDELVADILERPTLAAAEGPERPRFYGPGDEQHGQ
jgi:hypothetical protein